MQTDPETPAQQGEDHLWRDFRPRRKEQARELCALLGWKIFTITDSTLNLANGYVPAASLCQFWEGVRECSLSHVLLEGNRATGLLLPLSRVFFPNLIVLSLASNNIASLEPLQRLSTATLKVLLLADNRIASLRPLAKTDLRALEILGLNKNCLAEVGEVMTKLNAGQLRVIEASENRCRSDGLAMIVKNFSRNLKEIEQSSGVVVVKTLGMKRAMLEMQPKLRRYAFP